MHHFLTIAIMIFLPLFLTQASDEEPIKTLDALISNCGTAGPQKTVSLQDPATNETQTQNCIEAMVYGCQIFCTAQECAHNNTQKALCLKYCPNAKQTCLSDDDDIASLTKSDLTKDIATAHRTDLSDEISDLSQTDDQNESLQQAVGHAKTDAANMLKDATAAAQEKTAQEQDDTKKSWLPHKTGQEVLKDESHDTSDIHPTKETTDQDSQNDMEVDESHDDEDKEADYDTVDSEDDEDHDTHEHEDPDIPDADDDY